MPCLRLFLLFPMTTTRLCPGGAVVCIWRPGKDCYSGHLLCRNEIWGELLKMAWLRQDIQMI